MDALSVLEQTGLPYASKVRMRDTDGVEKPVMHACGHDMHVVCLMATAELLSNIKDSWRGTLVVLFQPSEERGGSAAMITDGLYSKIPVPDYILGQHVGPYRAGSVVTRTGPILAASDNFHITLHGHGGHGSAPHLATDAVVMAANVVVRLQTIVIRESDPNDRVVVTVGSLDAGHAENIIANSAELKVNVRTTVPKTRDKVLGAIRRMVKAECEASNAPKPADIIVTSSFSPTINDTTLTMAISSNFNQHFGSQNFDSQIEPPMGSEDFSYLATAKSRPSTFWFFGGTPSEELNEKVRQSRINEIPANYSGHFAPCLRPTLRTGMEALCVGALTVLIDDSLAKSA